VCWKGNGLRENGGLIFASESVEFQWRLLGKHCFTIYLKVMMLSAEDFIIGKVGSDFTHKWLMTKEIQARTKLVDRLERMYKKRSCRCKFFRNESIESMISLVGLTVGTSRTSSFKS
jgi:hypothetical protein